MKRAQYELMKDGQFFATIPEFDGLYAVGKTREEAEVELRDTLDGWLDVHIKIGREGPPEIDGLSPLELPKSVQS
jgi:predicted RNase H-like HicB family nuclease